MEVPSRDAPASSRLLDIDDLSSATTSRRLREARILERRLRPVLAEFGLSIGEWLVLDVLQILDTPTIGAVVDATGIPNANVSRHLDALESHALIFRRASESDGRVSTVHLSRFGTDLLAELGGAATAD